MSYESLKGHETTVLRNVTAVKTDGRQTTEQQVLFSSQSRALKLSSDVFSSSALLSAS